MPQARPVSEAGSVLLLAYLASSLARPPLSSGTHTAFSRREKKDTERRVSWAAPVCGRMGNRRKNEEIVSLQRERKNLQAQKHRITRSFLQPTVEKSPVSGPGSSQCYHVSAFQVPRLEAMKGRLYTWVPFLPAVLLPSIGKNLAWRSQGHPFLSDSHQFFSSIPLLAIYHHY